MKSLVPPFRILCAVLVGLCSTAVVEVLVAAEPAAALRRTVARMDAEKIETVRLAPHRHPAD
jgi:hypothetical protein